MGKSSLSFSSNKNVFILPPLLRDIFDGFKISGWLTLFFQHWKKDTPLSSSLYYFWWKLSVHSYYCSLMYDTMCLPPPPAAFKMFSLCLVFSNLTWCLSMVFFFIVLGICRPPQVCEIYCPNFNQIWKSFNYHIVKYFLATISLLSGIQFTHVFYHPVLAGDLWGLFFFFFPRLGSVYVSFLLAVFHLPLNISCQIFISGIELFYSRFSIWFLFKFPFFLRCIYLREQE